MTVRLGMTDLINRLRQYGQAEQSEYTIGGETYWTDDHLQAVLDRYRTDIYSESLAPVGVFESGATVYRDYPFRYGDVERAESGTAIWQLWTTGGVQVGTADYTPDYNAKMLRFGTPTDGGQRVLNYRTYDLYRAAADVWRQKAANVANRFDVSTDNHSLKRSQLRDSYLEMANFYDQQAAKGNGTNGMSGGRVVKLSRIDTNG